MRVSNVNAKVEWTPERDDILLRMYSAGESLIDIAKELGITPASVAWRCRMRKLNRERNPNAMGALPMPEDFMQYAGRVSRNSLHKMYGVGWGAIDRWLKQAGMTMDIPRPVPADWAQVAPHFKRTELSQRYKASLADIRRWIEETGVDAMQYNYVKKSMNPSRDELVKIKHIEPRVFDAEVKVTAPFAAKYLQKIYPNVHSAAIRLYETSKETWGSVRGLPDKGKNHYHVSGKGALWLDEVIALAVKHGFDPVKGIEK